MTRKKTEENAAPSEREIDWPSAVIKARFNEWVREVKRLRAAADGARHAMFVEIEAMEVGEPEVWSCAGFAFGQLIEHLGLAKGSEYSAWKAGHAKLVSAVGEDRASRISTETAKLVGPMQRLDDVREIAERDEAFRNSNGVPAAESSARTIVRNVRLVSAVRRNRTKSVADLEREIERLRAKLAAADEQIKTLRAALRAARKAA